MGGPSGEAYRTTMNASGFTKEQALAREAIQNSVDAHDDSGDTVSVTFKARDLQGGELEALDSILGLTSDFSPRASYLDEGTERALAALKDEDGVLQALLIEDFQTVGLGGPLDRVTRTSHFRNLLLELGYGAKARQDEFSGGSYGFGKSVYSSSSSLRTVIAYSRFNSTEETNGASRRLMGCAYFEGHEFEGKSFTGRAWFGAEESSNETFPFEDDEADELAQKLRIPVRGEKQNGTSILILGTDIDLRKLRDATEDYWWPRLYESQLDVEFIAGDTYLEPPRPRMRADLRPYIIAYEIACRIAEPDSEKQRRVNLQQYADRHLGKLGFVAYDYDETVDQDEFIDSKFVNSVALMRSTRMVIEYSQCGRPNLEPAVGVFISHDDVERILKLSEPGMHDNWDPNSSRLVEEESQAIVRRILEKVEQNFRTFQRGLRPPPPRTDGRIRELEKLVGRFFKTKNPNPPPPPPRPSDPFTIHFAEKERQLSNGKAVDIGLLELGLREDAEVANAEVEVEIACHLLFDDQQVMGSSVPLELSPVALADLALAGQKLTGRLNTNEKVSIKYTSAPYDAAFVTSVSLSVEGKEND